MQIDASAHRSPCLPGHSRINLPYSVERPTTQDCRINTEQSRLAGGGWSLSIGFSPEAQCSRCTSSPLNRQCLMGNPFPIVQYVKTKGWGSDPLEAHHRPQEESAVWFVCQKSAENWKPLCIVSNGKKIILNNKNKRFSCHLLNLGSH